MRSDAGINGDAQCIEQMTWMFFLKGYDTQEETWEYKAYKEKKEYNSIIPESLRRRQNGAEYRARYPALFFVLKKSDLFLGTVAEIGNGCGNLIYLKA